MILPGTQLDVCDSLNSLTVTAGRYYGCLHFINDLSIILSKMGDTERLIKDQLRAGEII